jgi:hypothetical protein
MEIQSKITELSGERKNWERWNVTFLAQARLRGYRNFLVGLEVAPNKKDTKSSCSKKTLLTLDC